MSTSEAALRKLTKNEVIALTLEYQAKFDKTLPNIHKELCEYSRRECLETTGVPDSISNDDLQEPTIKDFDKLDVAIYRSNIEDCHWLKINGPKGANAIRKNKKKSKGMNLCSIGINNPVFINDRFCSYYTI